MLCVISGFCSGRIPCAHHNSLTLKLREGEWLAQERTAHLSTQFWCSTSGPCFLIVYLFHFVIICETVFSCYLSLGRNQSSHSFWKKVQCCYLISSAAISSFPSVNGISRHAMLQTNAGLSSWPFANSESSKNGDFSHLSLNANFPSSNLCHRPLGQIRTSHLSSLCWIHIPASHLSGMPSYTQAPRGSNCRLVFQSFLFCSFYPSHYELLCFLLTGVD